AIPPRAQRRRPRSYPRPDRSISPRRRWFRRFATFIWIKRSAPSYTAAPPWQQTELSARLGRCPPPGGKGRAGENARRARQHCRGERLAQDKVTLHDPEHRGEQQHLACRRDRDAGERLRPAPEGEGGRHQDVVDRVDGQLRGEPDRVAPFENDRGNSDGNAADSKLPEHLLPERAFPFSAPVEHRAECPGDGGRERAK